MGLLLLTLLVRADDYITVTHNFKAKASAKDIAFTGSNKIGTIKSDGTTYTCSSGAAFDFYSTILSAILPKDEEIVVSPAINRLSHFQVVYYANSPTIEISLSTDGSSWTPVTENITSGSGYHEVSSLFGNYYIKVKNTTSTILYIQEFTYYSHPDCGCFPYVPE